jgi:hypothetical protein
MMDDDECGAAGGKINKENQNTQRNLPQCHLVEHKSHII